MLFPRKSPIATKVSAPERLETPICATETSTGNIVINVAGVPDTTGPWVHTNKYPVHPMPKGECITHEQLPLYSAASPMSWFIKECFNSENGLIIEIPVIDREFYCYAYGKESMGVQKVGIFLSESGIMTAIAWGYSNRPFETAYMTDVRTLFADCISTKGISTNLADSKYIYDHLKSTSMMTRVAYGLTPDGAEDVLDVLLTQVSVAVATTSAKIINHLLQPELTRLRDYLSEKARYLEDLNKELDMIVCKATRKYDNTETFHELHEITEKYSELTRIIRSTTNTYLFFNHLNHALAIKLDLAFITEIYDCDLQVSNRIRRCFDLMRL